MQTFLGEVIATNLLSLPCGRDRRLYIFMRLSRDPVAWLCVQGRFATREEVAAMKAEAAALAASSQADDAMMPSPFAAAAFEDALMPSLSSGGLADEDVRVPVLGLV